MIIRICTEDKNPAQTRVIVAQFFDCFTIVKSEGCWKGTYEHAVTIEIAVLGNDTESQHLACVLAQGAALAIKCWNEQEAVLIEYIDSKNELL